MNYQGRFAPAGQVILALSFLSTGLLQFESALFYDRLENNLLADNWGFLLAICLTLTFGLGWFLEILVEKLASSRGRKPALFAYFGVASVWVVIVFGSINFISPGFLSYAVSACGYIFMSSFLFHFSAARPETIAKLQ